MIKNHWGVWIDSDKPITCVYSGNSIAWEWIFDDICLDCESQVKIHGDSSEYNPDCENCLEWDSFCLDWLECDPSHTRIIGDWIFDTKTGLYEPDKKGEFAAIVNESTVQVVFSQLTEKHGLCSPCYPGQADYDSQGDFLSYILPEWAIYK